MSTKFTIEQVRRIFQDGEAELLSTSYSNNASPLEYKCLRCGEKDTAILNNFKRGHRGCCGGTGKLTLSKAQNIFQLGDATLLEKNYIDCKTKMAYRCHSCKREDKKVSLSKFKDGQRPCCGFANGRIKARKNIEFIRRFFEENQAILLSDEYLNAKGKLSYKCSLCENTDSVSWDKFKAGQRPCCGFANGRKKVSIGLEKAKEAFLSNHATLLSTVYKNAHTKMDYKCHLCGNEDKVSLSKFKDGTRPCCNYGRPYDLEYASSVFTKGNATLLSRKYINSKTKMKYLCHCCNETLSVSLQQFDRGQRPCCGHAKGGETFKRRLIARRKLRLVLSSKEFVEENK